MLLDAHAHLDYYDPPQRRAALAEIEQHRILTFAVAMDPASYRRTCAISRLCPLVIPSFGIHPNHAPAFANRLDTLRPLINASAMLGEIGLDYHWVEDPAHYPAQRAVFEFFLAAAGEQNKIVNLHTKGAEAEVLALLQRYKVRRAIVHWYSGPLDVLHALVDWGAYFTIGVEINHSPTIRAIARALPPERVLTETDNPAGLDWLTGETGMPRHVKDVIQTLAALWNMTAAQVIYTVERNLRRLLGDDPRLAGIATLLPNRSDPL